MSDAPDTSAIDDVYRMAIVAQGARQECEHWQRLCLVLAVFATLELVVIAWMCWWRT